MPLYFGKNIRQKGDQLTEVTVGQLHQRIVTGAEGLADDIAQLRQIQSIDPGRYSELKKRLPYFLGATFYPAIRKKDHFAGLEYFIIDLDHFDALDAPDLSICRAQLLLREDLVMLFTSPGGNGLKLVFRLEATCADVGLYRLFYQRFLERLINEHDLASVADTVTHDVARVSFMSHDPAAVLRKEAERIKLEAYVDQADPFLPELIRQAAVPTVVTTAVSAAAVIGPDEETLQAIKQKLNPAYRPKPRKKANTPERLEEILPAIERKLLDEGIELAAQQAIQYGKQLRVTMGNYWAEINMFHGKKGFSVVKTAKSGSQPDLAEVAARLIEDYLNTET